MKLVIPAGGLGSRFLPVTSVVPKELLPLGRLPLIHHALLEAERGGFDSAVVVTAPGKGMLRTYFESNRPLETRLLARGDRRGVELLRAVRDIASRLRLAFVEQAEPAGLGDAILACRSRVATPFGVLLPDDVVPTADHWRRMWSIHADTSASVLSVRDVPAREINRFGVAECVAENGRLRVVGLVEKPAPGAVASRLAVFGRYIVTEPVLEALSELSSASDVELQLTDGFAAVLGREPAVLALKFADDFYDCGTPEAYARSVARYMRHTGESRRRG